MTLSLDSFSLHLKQMSTLLSTKRKGDPLRALLCFDVLACTAFGLVELSTNANINRPGVAGAVLQTALSLIN